MVIKKIAVLFSGSGSNLEKILEKVHNKTFSFCRIEVANCICNKKEAVGIEKAKKFGLNTVLIEHKNFQDRESFDKELVKVIKQSEVELVVLAGFMRFLTPYFTQNVKAIEESYNSSMKIGGITVHYVNEELDGGEIIAQECFPKKEGMSIEEFEENIHSLEHELLPKTIINLLDNES